MYNIDAVQLERDSNFRHLFHVYIVSIYFAPGKLYGI